LSEAKPIVDPETLVCVWMMLAATQMGHNAGQFTGSVSGLEQIQDKRTALIPKSTGTSITYPKGQLTHL